MQRLNLYQRLKPETKLLLDSKLDDYPFSHKCIVEALTAEYFWINVPYGIAHDVMNYGKLDFFGDAFEIKDE